MLGMVENGKRLHQGVEFALLGNRILTMIGGEGEGYHTMILIQRTHGISVRADYPPQNPSTAFLPKAYKISTGMPLNQDIYSSLRTVSFTFNSMALRFHIHQLNHALIFESDRKDEAALERPCPFHFYVWAEGRFY